MTRTLTAGIDSCEALVRPGKTGKSGVEVKDPVDLEKSTGLSHLGAPSLLRLLLFEGIGPHLHIAEPEDMDL